MDEQNLSLEERVKRLEEVVIFCHGTLNLEELEARRKEDIKRREQHDKRMDEILKPETTAKLYELQAELKKEKDERNQLEKMDDIEDWEDEIQ